MPTRLPAGPRCRRVRRVYVVPGRPRRGAWPLASRVGGWLVGRSCYVGKGGLVRLLFQAEDGIRDLTVTGVQTCALPILLIGDERAEVGLLHERSGELVVLSEPDAWFAYPFWLDDRSAPDYARTVDIHRKPG